VRAVAEAAPDARAVLVSPRLEDAYLFLARDASPA
jgi:hypothetical protein